MYSFESFFKKMKFFFRQDYTVTSNKILQNTNMYRLLRFVQMYTNPVFMLIIFDTFIHLAEPQSPSFVVLRKNSYFRFTATKIVNYNYNRSVLFC